VSLFRLPADEPLAEYDAGLAQRLLTLLTRVLCNELDTSESEARELAAKVVWTVSRERDRMWLNLTYDGGSVIGAGGDPRRNEDGLTLYVRQMAYELVGRDRDFEP
jgi:hypothetical protein